MYISSGRPSRAEIEILFNPGPVVPLNLAVGKYVKRRAGSDGHISNDQAGVVCRKMAMDRGRQDAKSVIEKDN